MAVQAKKYEKVNHDKREKIHLLSGILKCPVCGAGMYGNKSIKKRKDGSNYKDFYYYGCKHRTMTRGHKCEYRKQIREELLDDAVTEVIVALVSKPKFASMMQEKINMKVDTSMLDQEIANHEKQLRQFYSIKSKLMEEIDSLDPDDRHYFKRKADLDDRLYRMYDKIEDEESQMIEARAKRQAIEAEKLTGDNIYKVLMCFDKLYSAMNDVERRRVMEALISEIQIHEDRQPNGQWLKSIRFRLPIIEEDMNLSLDNNEHVETFQYKDYADRYSDAYELYGYDAEALFNHYETVGKAENRVGRFKKTAEEDDRHPYVWDADEPLDPLPPLDFHAQPDWFDARTLPENLSNVRIIKEYEQLEAFIEKDEWIGDPVLVRKEELLTEMSSRVRNYDGRRGGADYLRAISQDIDVLLDFMG